MPVLVNIRRALIEDGNLIDCIVNMPAKEDDFDFKVRFTVLKAEFEAQLQEEAALNKAIAENLARVEV